MSLKMNIILFLCCQISHLRRKSNLILGTTYIEGMPSLRPF